MFNPLECDGKVTSIQGPCYETLVADSHTVVAVFCSKGTVKIGSNAQLGQGDTALFGTQEVSCELDNKASAFVISVARRT